MYELPSVPVIVTCVAFAAITVMVDELPEVIEVGLAVTLTVGAVVVFVLSGSLVELAPQPVKIRRNKRTDAGANGLPKR